jgi:putative acetyltransferase
MTVSIREATDADGYALSALLGAVFAEYQGTVFVSDEMPELQAVATTFCNKNGRFWVAEREVRGRAVVVGCIGYAAAGAGIELKKLYVAKSERNGGLGGRLVDLVEDTATQRRAAFIELWSDTRFTTAHRFYQKRGYLRGEHTRDLYDASASVEYYFRKALA